MRNLLIPMMLACAILMSGCHIFYGHTYHPAPAPVVVHEPPPPVVHHGPPAHVCVHDGHGRCHHSCGHYFYRGGWYAAPPPGWHIEFHN